MNLSDLNKANSGIAAQKKLAEDAIKLEAVLAAFDKVSKDHGFKDFPSVLGKLEAIAQAAPELPAAPQVSAEAESNQERKKRGKVTDDKRSQALRMLKEVDSETKEPVYTLAKIAEALDLSIGTISSIKKAAGLTNPKAKA